MQKTEFQIILKLLQDKKNVNMNYRQLAMETGTSIGSVHNTMQSLMEKGYIVENGNNRLLRKRTALLDRWARAYADGLKERYFVARFAFLTPQVKANWQDIHLPNNASWGGEPAAALTDGYLQPERWDIYIADTANAMIATGRMIPNANGEIYIYNKFWKEDGTPLAVVYADMMAMDNDRCRESAERLKKLI